VLDTWRSLDYVRRVNETLGERIVRLRKARGWSARELGRRAGMGDAAISRIETGKVSEPRLATMTRLADALGVSVGELRGAESERRQAVLQPLRAAVTRVQVLGDQATIDFIRAVVAQVKRIEQRHRS